MALLPKRDPDEVGVLADEFAALKAADAARIDRFHMYRAEGEEVRSSQAVERSAPPEVRDYGSNRNRNNKMFRHRIALPLSKALNVKHSYRIAGRLPDVFVDQRDESPEERYRSDTIEKLVWSMFRASRAETQFSSAAWDGSELGASCFDVYMNIEKNLPIFRAVDPAGIIVVEGVDDPHEFERVYRFWDAPVTSVVAQYRGKKFRGEDVRVEHIKTSHDHEGVAMVTLVSMCDHDRQTVFLPNCKVGLSEYDHRYGFAPYVVIPNVGPEREVWGWADYEFVRPLVAYISSMFSREADIIRAVANGTYQEKGTGQNPELIQQTLAEGGVIPSKRDGEITPIQPPEVPQFETAHADRAMELFKMLGFAPDASWGNGFSGSASDRGLMLQPLVEFTAHKQMNWEAGLGRLFNMALRMFEAKMTGTTTYRGTKQSSGSRNRQAFAVTLGSNLEAEEAPNPQFSDALASGDPGAAFEMDEYVRLPRSPEELFQGDYEVRFTWNNRIDPDDPSFVLSETNKFTAGVQSLERTMERLGVEAPEEEMRRMESEADRFPWINQGLIQIIRAQIAANAQGDGGGAPEDVAGNQAAGLGVASGNQGDALGGDAAIQGMGGAAQSGIPYGSA